MSGGSNIKLLNYGICNYYPDPPKVLTNASNRYITIERNASIQQSINISAGPYFLNFSFGYNQYYLLANPLKVYFDNSLIDTLPTNDSIDTLPKTNIIAQTSGSHI